MGFLSFLNSSRSKPSWAAQCTLAYTDRQNRRYYQYPDMLDMCVHRKGEIDKCLMELRYSTHSDVLEALKDATNAHKRGSMQPDIVKIGFLVNEITDRSELLLSSDILFKICANTLIREDENPYVVDDEILIEKITTFKAEIKQGGLHGFFQSVGLLRLIGLSNIMPHELTKYMNAYNLNQENIHNILCTSDRV